MTNRNKKLLFVKATCWLGIIADAVWAAALFIPSFFGILTGANDFNPDLQIRQIMAIGGSLMAGWTVLLVWVVRNPLERRGVLLITAFPVVFGIFIVALAGFLNGNSGNIWILVKTSFIFAAVIISYFLANPEIG